MRAYGSSFVLLAMLAGCSDQTRGLSGPPGQADDGSVDSAPAAADTAAVFEETGGRMDAANATGGVLGSGGVTGEGGAGAGGAVGAGGRGTIDAANATDSASASTGGQVSGTGASGGGGATGSTTTILIGTGGGAGGSIDAGDAERPGLDGGSGTGGTTSLLDLVPRSNSIPGWTIDPSNSVTAARVAAVARTLSEAEALIDGAAADFFTGPATPTMFAWQNYVNARLPSPGSEPGGSALSLYLLELPSAEQASAFYSSLRQAYLYVGAGWTDPTSPAIGIRSRIADTGDTWWINFCKGRYYAEVRMTPSYGPPPDYVPGDASQKQAALAFAAAVAARM